MRERPVLAESPAVTWAKALGWRSKGLADPVTDKGDAVRFMTTALLLFASFFCAPSILGGLFADDILHQLIFREFPEHLPRTWNVFSFMKSPAEVEVYRTWGVLPWWTSDGARIDFFRPIPTLTHWLDWALFSYAPTMAHLHSIAWYFGSMWLASRVWVRFLPKDSRLILLVVAIFGLNGSHALNVQWIASRNDLIVSVFLLTSFLGWLRLRERPPGERARAVDLAMLFGGFVAALFSKESGVLLLPLLALHAVLFPAPGLEQASLLRRLTPHGRLLGALALIAAAVVAWYFDAGHGPETLVYLNPLKHPLEWVVAFPRALLFHVVAMTTGVSVMLFGASPVLELPAVTLPLIALGVALAVLMARLLEDDRASWFFAAWAAVFLVQMTTFFPDARFLYQASVGGAFVVARAIAVLAEKRAEGRLPRLASGTLLAIHLGVAPVVMQATFVIVGNFKDRSEQVKNDLKAALDYEALGDPATEVFFVNWHQRETTPLAGLWLSQVLPSGIDLHATLAADQGDYVGKIDRTYRQMKVHYTPLSFLLTPLELRVLDEHTVTLSPKTSTGFFPSIFEQLYLTDPEFTVGHSVKLPHFTATIEEIAGDPARRSGTEVSRVRFTFAEPVTTARYAFVAWDGERFNRVALAPGQVLTLPGK